MFLLWWETLELSSERLFVVGVLPIAKLQDQTEINADLISDEAPFFLAAYSSHADGAGGELSRPHGCCV